MKYVFSLLILAHSSYLSVAYSGETVGSAATSQLYQLYQGFDSEASMPEFELFQLAVTGHLNLREGNKLGERDLITIIDFRKPSSEKRLWVIDLKAKKVLFHTLVAHGKNTGDLYAQKFSNVPNSNTSSIGFFVTAQTYTGKHGLSLRLDGQELGYNEKARSRAIVMHGADYVSADFVKKYGRLGRSFGCPSIPMAEHEAIINTVKDGTSLLIYYPDKNYLAGSKLLKQDKLLAQLQLLQPSENSILPNGISQPAGN